MPSGKFSSSSSLYTTDAGQFSPKFVLILACAEAVALSVPASKSGLTGILRVKYLCSRDILGTIHITKDQPSSTHATFKLSNIRYAKNKLVLITSLLKSREYL